MTVSRAREREREGEGESMCVQIMLTVNAHSITESVLFYVAFCHVEKKFHNALSLFYSLGTMSVLCIVDSCINGKIYSN